MSIEQWWPKLSDSTREWLIAHNGEVLDAEIAQAIAEAGGSPIGSSLSDEETDWIEAAANEE